MTETETQQVDVTNLRLEAYKQRLVQLVSQYEELDTERRIQITILSLEKDKLEERVKELESAQEEAKPKAKK